MHTDVVALVDHLGLTRHRPRIWATKRLVPDDPSLVADLSTALRLTPATIESMLRISDTTPSSYLPPGARFCPRCLESTGTYDRRWTSPWAIVCTRHHVLLVDRCPLCENRRRRRPTDRVGPSSAEITIAATRCREPAPDWRSPCGYPLGSSGADAASASQLARQQHLDQLRHDTGTWMYGRFISGRDFLILLDFMIEKVTGLNSHAMTLPDLVTFEPVLTHAYSVLAAHDPEAGQVLYRQWSYTLPATPNTTDWPDLFPRIFAIAFGLTQPPVARPAKELMSLSQKKLSISKNRRQRP